MLVPLSESDVVTNGDSNISNDFRKNQRLPAASMNQRSGVTILPSC